MKVSVSLPVTSPNNDCICFGPGFAVNKNFSQTGMDEYNDFLVKVLNNPAEFDEIF
ncbi:MAG TPA: hypothetical protein HPP94_04830 [Desulfuromonadales bacterium]|nr:hypothetical protein [Desulfuromonadales bacterium]